MSNAESPSNSPQPPKHVNPFLKAIMLVFVFIAMAFHEPAKYLRKRVYDSSAGGFLAFLGVIASLGAGIGAGYYLGWMVEAPVVKWLGGGVIASVLTWFYVWPDNLFARLPQGIRAFGRTLEAGSFAEVRQEQPNRLVLGAAGRSGLCRRGRWRSGSRLEYHAQRPRLS